MTANIAIEQLHFWFDKRWKSKYLYQEPKYHYVHSYLNGEFFTAIKFTLADLYIDGNIKDTLKHDAIDRLLDHVVDDITLYDRRTDANTNNTKHPPLVLCSLLWEQTRLALHSRRPINNYQQR